MFAGKKTYLTAVLMATYAVSGYLLGKTPDLDWTLLLEAAGLASLRHALSSR